VPFSLVGAIWLLYLLDYNLSVAVWVGLIALAGLDAETGVVMLLYLTSSHRRWKAERQAAHAGGSRGGDRRRARPGASAPSS
jgi:Cu(I)/Ag(I) efflux system membrane protein CusA/SilA